MLCVKCTTQRGLIQYYKCLKSRTLFRTQPSTSTTRYVRPLMHTHTSTPGSLEKYSKMHFCGYQMMLPAFGTVRRRHCHFIKSLSPCPHLFIFLYLSLSLSVLRPLSLSLHYYLQVESSCVWVRVCGYSHAVSCAIK